MSVIQKVETGYLQFLRIVFLAFATIAIGAAVVTGVKFLVTQNSEPVYPDHKVELKAETYFSNTEEADQAQNASAENKGQSAADPLKDQFVAVIQSQAKRLSPESDIDTEGVVGVFDQIAENPELGRDYLQQLVPVLDAAFKKIPTKPMSTEDYVDTVRGMLDHFETEYQKQSEAVAEARRQAEEEAAEKRGAAFVNLYIAAIGFATFVMLILMVVLLKIERNLRNNTLATPTATA